MSRCELVEVLEGLEIERDAVRTRLSRLEAQIEEARERLMARGCLGKSSQKHASGLERECLRELTGMIMCWDATPKECKQSLSDLEIVDRVISAYRIKAARILSQHGFSEYQFQQEEKP